MALNVPSFSQIGVARRKVSNAFEVAPKGGHPPPTR